MRALLEVNSNIRDEAKRLSKESTQPRHDGFTSNRTSWPGSPLPWQPLLVTVTSALVANENHTMTVSSWPALHPNFSDGNGALPREPSWHPPHLLRVCSASPPILGTLYCTSLQLGEILNRCCATIPSWLKTTLFSNHGVSPEFLPPQYEAYYS